MKFTTFIWDYDGTLFDTYDAVTRAYYRAVKSFDIAISFDELRLLVKHSLSWAAQELQARFAVPQAELLRVYYGFAPEEETLEAMRPYEGAAEVLRAICAHGGQNFLYSHRDRVSIAALEAYGLKPYFSGFITKDDHFPRKPAPDALLHLIKAYSLDPAACVMVGDRVLDVEAGLNAGMAGALFDPENFCQGNAPTPYQYASMAALQRALVD